MVKIDQIINVTDPVPKVQIKILDQIGGGGNSVKSDELLSAEFSFLIKFEIFSLIINFFLLKYSLKDFKYFCKPSNLQNWKIMRFIGTNLEGYEIDSTLKP